MWQLRPKPRVHAVRGNTTREQVLPEQGLSARYIYYSKSWYRWQCTTKKEGKETKGDEPTKERTSAEATGKQSKRQTNSQQKGDYMRHKEEQETKQGIEGGGKERS